MTSSIQALPVEIRSKVYSYLFPQVCLPARPLDIITYRTYSHPITDAWAPRRWTYRTYSRPKALQPEIAAVRNLMLTAQSIRQELSQLFYSSITPTFEVVSALIDFTQVTTAFTLSMIHRIAVIPTLSRLQEKTTALAKFPDLRHVILRESPQTHYQWRIWFLNVAKGVMGRCPQLKHSHYGTGAVVHLSSTEITGWKLREFDVKEELEKIRIAMLMEK